MMVYVILWIVIRGFMIQGGDIVMVGEIRRQM